MKKIIFQIEPINLTQALSQCGADKDGSILTFLGQARNKSRDLNVTHLEYEIYPSMAEKEMQKIVDHACKNWDITDCIVIHRYGTVKIAETSILIALSSPHRVDSYEASRYIIDTIKKTVPIWKKEFYNDGTQWITDRS
jgi:molybdopterin synthase catalytic subunit